MPTFVGQFSMKAGKRSWRYVENERKQFICQLFLADFQRNLENVSGAMSRYFFAP